MAYFDYDKYTGKKSEDEDTKKPKGYFDYDKYTKNSYDLLPAESPGVMLKATVTKLNENAKKAEPKKAAPPPSRIEPKKSTIAPIQTELPNAGTLLKQTNKTLNSYQGPPKPEPLPGRDLPNFSTLFGIGNFLKGADKIAEFTKPASDISQNFIVPGASAANIAGFSGAVGNALLRGAPKLAQSTKLLPTIVRGAVTEAATGAPLGAGATLASNPGASGKQIAEGAEFGGALGAVGGSAAPFLGSGVSAAFGKFFQRGKNEPEALQEILALPLGREDAARLRRSINPESGPTVNVPETEPRGLPESSAYNEIQRIKAQQTRELPSPSERLSRKYDVQQGRYVNTPSGDVINIPGDSVTLGLPKGGPTAPKLKVENNPQAVLEYVLQKIKPEVVDIIEPPARRDLLINYIQTHTGIPKAEIWNIPQKDLVELGQSVRQSINLPEIASGVAKKYGYNLMELLEGKIPTVSGKISEDAQKAAYGIYPKRINVREPHLTRRVEGQALAPRQRFVRTEQRQAPKVEPTESPEQIAQRREVQRRVLDEQTRLNKLRNPQMGYPADAPVQRMTRLKDLKSETPKAQKNISGSNSSTRSSAISASDAEKMAADYVRTNPGATTSEMQKMFGLGYTNIGHIQDAVNKGVPYKGLERYFEAGKKTTNPAAAIKALMEPESKPAAAQSTRAKAMANLKAAPTRTKAPPPGMNQRGLLRTFEQSGKLTAKTLRPIRKSPESNYEPINNVDTVAAANKRVTADTMNDEKGYLLSKDPNKEYFSPEDIATGFRLIDEFSAKGDHESASQIALKLMQAGTKGGQSIQINAIYNRLTPQGILKVATRVFNEGVKDIHAQKALPPEIAEQITTAAEAMQQASGKESLSKAAISIFEKARSGKPLTESEVSTLRSFANEAKRLLPKSEKTTVPKERTVDRVKKASASAADAARKRIAAARNLGFAAQGKGNPVIDYAIIGFDHMMKGAVKFADFSAKMKGEFGDKIDDVLDKVYLNAYGRYRRANKIKQSEFEKMTNRALVGEKISDADADVLRKMAIELSQLEGAAKNEAMADLQVAFNTFREGSTGKKAASVLRSVQLGNARTILRNEVSNNAFYALDTVRRKFVATPFDIVASKISGKNREIFWKGGPQSFTQYFRDWGTGYRQGRKGLNPGGLQSQYDLGNLAFNPKSTKLTDRLGSFMERNVGAFMKAGDYAAANRAISNELSQVAQAKAYSEGLRGKELRRKAEEYFHTADTKMTDQAQKYGEYMTFQDKNFLSDAAVALRDKVLNFGQDFGLGNVVINYPKTPANILMRAVDYSPLGFVKFMTQMGKAAFKKDVTKKELIDTFTRALAGTGIAGMGLYLSKLGLLNVLPSKDIGVSELERKAGKIPNSLNITALKRYVMSFGDPDEAKPKQGDTYASVDWFQPLAIPMSVGAAAGQSGAATRANTGVNAASAAGQSLDAAMESFGNMSVYRNIKDLVGNSYTTPSQKFGKLTANAISMFTPALLGQVRNVVDPKLRDTGTKSGFMGGVKGQLMNRIPGLSSKLPESVDTFGDTKQSDYPVVTRALNAFLNPSLVDQYTPTPEAKAVLDLIERTGEKRLAPNRPTRSMTYKKQTYGFTQDQYREYQKITGNYVTEELNKALEYLNDPKKTDEQKIKEVDDAVRTAGEKAKKDMREKMGIK